MRKHALVATLAAAAMLVVVGSASASASQTQENPADAAPCFGLSCHLAGEADVPEARGFATWVSGPRALERQTSAGFYDYGSGTSLGQPAIAFVVPRGQFDRMPASVRALRLVQKIAETDDFATSNVVILGHGIFEWAPPDDAASAATTRHRSIARSARHRIRAHAASDQYGCPDDIFCLYDQDNWQPPGIGLSHGWNGLGWVSLSACCGWGDRANSMRNNRVHDSLLDKNNPPTFGDHDRYCANSGTADSDFTNNFGGPPFPGANGGDNEASTFNNTNSYTQC